MKLIPIFQTEANLVAACQKADPKAQRTFYDYYASRMLGVCKRYFSDDFEAEEAMIEGFVKAFERINQFKADGSLEGWLWRICVNECLMALRAKKRLGWQTSYEDALVEPNPQLPETVLETQDLLNLIGQLPTGYRTVFNLFAIEGYTHEEIAATLGISESTSKSQLHRARHQLQTMIVRTSYTTIQ